MGRKIWTFYFLSASISTFFSERLQFAISQLPISVWQTCHMFDVKFVNFVNFSPTKLQMFDFRIFWCKSWNLSNQSLNISFSQLREIIAYALNILKQLKCKDLLNSLTDYWDWKREQIILSPQWELRWRRTPADLFQDDISVSWWLCIVFVPVCVWSMDLDKGCFHCQ